MKKANITISALAKLQEEIPEIKITSLNTNFQGFCSVGIQPPEYIQEFFMDFLQKAKECTDGHECQVVLLRDGKLLVNLILPNRNYSIGEIKTTPQEEPQ